MKILRAAYLIAVNTLALLFLAVAAIQLAQALHKAYLARTSYERLSAQAKATYAHMRPEDATELLRAYHTLPFRYDPWVGYREAEKASPYLNVDANGFRQNGPARRGIAEIDGAIWVLGGSTTFGYGVADAETIPAQMEKMTGRPVVNFGVAGFYSARENILLTYYLRLGYRPATAVFLDGINESCDLHDYRSEMTLLFARAQRLYSFDLLAFLNPLLDAVSGLRANLLVALGRGAPEMEDPGLDCRLEGRRLALRELLERHLQERAAICRLYGIDCRTFVQPFAGVHGRFDDEALDANERRKLGGQFRHLAGTWRDAGAVFVSGALDPLPRHAYVDTLHYSAEASTLIARAIVDHLK